MLALGVRNFGNFEQVAYLIRYDTLWPYANQVDTKINASVLVPHVVINAVGIFQITVSIHAANRERRTSRANYYLN